MVKDTLEPDDVTSSWPAFADLLAATTLLFLVLFAVVAIPALRKARLAGVQQTTLLEIESALKTLERERAVQIWRFNDYLLVRISGEATFPLRKSDLNDMHAEGRAIVVGVADFLRSDPKLVGKIDQIQVVGHTSSEGGPEYNWRLSAERAVSVSLLLINSGLPVCKITALGRGSYYPIAPSAHHAVDPRDRRIELEIHPLVPSDSLKNRSRDCLEPSR